MIGDNLGISAKVEPEVSRSDKQRITDDLTEAVERAEQQFSPDAGGGFEGRTMPGGGGGVGGGAAGAAAGGRLAGGSVGGAAKMLGTVALGGTLAVSLYNQLTQHSSYLQSVNSMFGLAVENFFRPYGDFLGKQLRPMAERLIEFSKDWNQLVDEKGLGFATGKLTIDWAKFITGPAWKDYITEFVWDEFVSEVSWRRHIPGLDWISHIEELNWREHLGSLSWRDYVPALAWSGFINPLAWPSYISSLAWGRYLSEVDWGRYVPEIAWRSHIPDLQWRRYFPSLSVGDVLDKTFGGATVSPSLVAGAIGWPFISGALIAKEIGWPYLTSDDIIPNFGFGTIQSWDLLDRIEFPTITADDIIDTLFGDDAPPDSTPPDDDDDGKWKEPINEPPDKEGPWAGGPWNPDDDDEELTEPPSDGLVRDVEDLREQVMPLREFTEASRRKIIEAMRNEEPMMYNYDSQGRRVTASEAVGTFTIGRGRQDPPMSYIENPPELGRKLDEVNRNLEQLQSGMNVTLQTSKRRLGESTREEENLRLERIASR